ncbi:MAG TPA: winged helix-turn-helix transcriptional regulator [Methanocella sp.]|nr:winged helix-turn-helix transcriptional regulator [Methanocella sp.]
MRNRFILLGLAITGITIAIIATLTLNIHTGTGGYVVTPGTPLSSGASPADAPAISSVTYWNLPLWVKVASAVDTLLILAGTVAALPAIIGRIQDLMDNSNRLAIFNYIVSNPGCTLAEITARQNIKSGTAKYHILMLEVEGKISRRRMGKFTRLYRNTMSTTNLEKVVASYLRNETSKALLQAIADRPGTTNRELSDRFGLDKSSIHWHTVRLLNDRVISFSQDGKYKHYFISEEARDAMVKLMPAEMSSNGPYGDTGITAHT